MKSFAAIASVFLFFLLINIPCNAELSSTFYDKTCPKALTTIRKSITGAVTRDQRMAASLIRLHFHDCFVQGCDASIMLDEAATSNSERTALPNINSVRGYEVIDAAKVEVEKTCPGVVSCADIIAIAARDASVSVSGPSWEVKLGRKDSTTASRDLANSELPSFSSSVETLIANFAKKGLNARDMVALSGAHTIGQAQCLTFRDRIYNNGSKIDPRFARERKRGCPVTSLDGNLAALDLMTPNSFDNNYFKNLMNRKGLLHSDQVLFNGGPTDKIVADYSRNSSLFWSDFGASMIKMGDIIDPQIAKNGVIRKLCSSLNH